MISFLGVTKGHADRPHGCKAMASGRVQEGGVPPPAQSAKPILF